MDTLAFTQELERGGLQPAAAAAIANAINHHVISQVATKPDIAILGTDLRAEMGRLGADLRGEIAGVHGEVSDLKLFTFKLFMATTGGTLTIGGAYTAVLFWLLKGHA